MLHSDRSIFDLYYVYSGDTPCPLRFLSFGQLNEGTLKSAFSHLSLTVAGLPLNSSGNNSHYFLPCCRSQTALAIMELGSFRFLKLILINFCV